MKKEELEKQINEVSKKLSKEKGYFTLDDLKEYISAKITEYDDGPDISLEGTMNLSELVLLTRLLQAEYVTE